MRKWMVMAACLGLFACGGPADEAVDNYEDDEEGVFDPMVGTIDRAEGVQDLNMDRKDRMDEAIEGSE